MACLLAYSRQKFNKIFLLFPFIKEMINIRISDLLMLIIHKQNGIHTYDISNYIKKLINMDYILTNDDLSLSLTDKAIERMESRGLI